MKYFIIIQCNICSFYDIITTKYTSYSNKHLFITANFNIVDMTWVNIQ